MQSEGKPLAGKIILVTGGSMGIGLESARACLSHGAKVVLCARGVEALSRAEAELEAEGFAGSVGVVSGDVGSEADVEAAFSFLEERFGACDGLIHAAAIYGPIGRMTDLDFSAWSETIRINLLGTFLVARAAARCMLSRGGRIVLFSGGGAANAFPNYSAYACSKAAVVRFTETIAEELAPNVEVNCVAPGLVITRMHEATMAAGERAGAEFFAKTRDAIASGGVPATVGAQAAAFLVSDAAKGITGKFVAAPYDGYRLWPKHLAELRDTDIFTLRRILPRDRNMDWQ
jgi:NAD(P)-dependent dehydrogenase (short-subunit alcohol dehydrogenase family)